MYFTREFSHLMQCDLNLTAITNAAYENIFLSHLDQKIHVKYNMYWHNLASIDVISHCEMF